MLRIIAVGLAGVFGLNEFAPEFAAWGLRGEPADYVVAVLVAALSVPVVKRWFN